MLRQRERSVDEALVFGDEVERHGHEDQRQQEILRGGHLQVEEVEQERARAEEEDRQGGIGGRPVGQGLGMVGLGLSLDVGFLGLLVLVVIVVNIEEELLFVFVLGDDGREVVNGGSEKRGVVSG